MEILAIFGLLAIIAVVFTGGGLLGWALKGMGSIFEFLSKGWGSCLRVIFWIFVILFLLIAMGL